MYQKRQQYKPKSGRKEGDRAGRAEARQNRRKQADLQQAAAAAEAGARSSASSGSDQSGREAAGMSIAELIRELSSGEQRRIMAAAAEAAGVFLRLRALKKPPAEARRSGARRLEGFKGDC